MTTNKTTKPAAWSEAEDILIVWDYLVMLQAVNNGRKINKAATRRALLPQLNNRSETSVEFKRMNISAVMVALGLDYLPGYRPASNYQRKLLETVKKSLPVFGLEATK
jgi:hypothetical protein